MPLHGAQNIPLPFRTLPLPVGIISFVPYAIDVSPYLQGQSTEPGIDIGKAAIHLRYPWILMLRTPDSPDEIVVDISANEITISGLSGLPVSTRRMEWDGPSAAQRFRPVYGVSAGAVAIAFGYTTDTAPIELSANAPLQDVLSGAPLAPDASYRFSVGSHADLGIAGRVSSGWTWDTRHGDFLVAWSVLVPLSIAHTHAFATTSVDTDENGLPELSDTSVALRYWYPSAGIGLSAQFDLSLTYRRGLFDVSVALLDMCTGDFSWGTNHIISGEAVTTETWAPASGFRVRPVPVFSGIKESKKYPDSATAIYAGLNDAGRLFGGGMFTVRENGNGAARLFSYATGFDAGAYFGAFFGWVSRRRYAEIGLVWKQELGYDESLVGLTLSIERTGSRSP
jgi:hypothetical protein